MTAPSEDEFKEILRDPYRDDPQWQPWHADAVDVQVVSFINFRHMLRMEMAVP